MLLDGVHILDQCYLLTLGNACFNFSKGNNALKSQLRGNLCGPRMAFDRFQNAVSGSDSYFSPQKNQVS